VVAQRLHLATAMKTRFRKIRRMPFYPFFPFVPLVALGAALIGEAFTILRLRRLTRAVDGLLQRPEVEVS
jgi:hypothetical protein